MDDENVGLWIERDRKTENKKRYLRRNIEMRSKTFIVYYQRKTALNT